MKQPLSIKDLINLLYQNREVIEMLFGNKESINKSEILARDDMSDEKLEKLAIYEIIHENNNIISLDDRIITFIEEVLEIGEVTTSFINDNIQSLNENLKYYRIDSNPRFLRNIKRSLKKINSTTSREVIKLHKNIDEAYKNQGNYLIKLQELDKYKRKRDDIINLIKETEQIIADAQDFFNTIVDAELSSIILDLRYTLVRNRDYLNEIQAQIIDYINKIQYQAEIYRKIQRLKELKDYEELKYKTNFVDVVASTNALMFRKRVPLKTRLSIDFLYSDQGSALTQKVASKLHLLRHTDRKPAGRMSDGFYETYKEESASLNIAGLVEKFQTGNVDLFQFVQSYNFPEKIGELSLEKRISLYVGISIDYDPQLDITDEFGFIELINDKGQKQKVGYALIKPKGESGKLKAESENSKAVESEKLKVESKKSKAESAKHKVESEELKIVSVEPKVEEGKEEKVELKAERVKPKVESKKPKAESKKTKTDGLNLKIGNELHSVPLLKDGKKKATKVKTQGKKKDKN
ncbi:MAG: hypothetical protein J7604_17730 [Sporocytophaga sp.]|uniref:hypothetical protein n=1 Tax=Sporocytophaga sp. TaxID=2231183 RepID=UPI001B18A8A6|nr:hypothetical protein [Sporocytophaga sp.]MBO9702053.1 hypothetical protein [Sporocytophaga sp.]